MDKKSILKKYTGKGGIVGDTIREIPKTVGKKIGQAYGNLKNKVKDSVTGGIVKFIGNTPAGDILKKGLGQQKKGVILNKIKKFPKTVPMLKEVSPKLPKSMPSIMPEAKKRLQMKKS